METCRFCKILGGSEEILGETDHFAIFFEPKPVSPGHNLIVSKSHKKDVFHLSQEEWTDFGKAVQLARSVVENKHKPDGYNIGTNAGEVAGQSQFHFHAHVMPRYKGDIGDSVGGVRNILGNSIKPKE